MKKFSQKAAAPSEPGLRRKTHLPSSRVQGSYFTYHREGDPAPLRGRGTCFPYHRESDPGPLKRRHSPPYIIELKRLVCQLEGRVYETSQALWPTWLSRVHPSKWTFGALPQKTLYCRSLCLRIGFKVQVLHTIGKVTLPP